MGKSFFVGSLVVLSLSLVGLVSVVGLLQSTERVGSSGIVVQPPPLPPPLPPPPPPEPSVEIDVYADAGCTQVLSSVEWGSVQPGGSVKRVIFIKNSGDAGVDLTLSTDNWSPAGAADKMQLFWDYGGGTLAAGVVVEVKLTLSVSSSISGVSSFSFDVVITGSAA